MKWLRLLLSVAVVSLSACNSGSIKEALDVADGVPRQTIDTSKLAINAFVNDNRFGSIPAQMAEVKSTLRLNSIRVLFAWNDLVQPTPDSTPNFGFYDEVADAIPAGSDALVLITGAPSWMSDPNNWIAGNPRLTFVELWLKKVASRYAGNPRIRSFQIWNEPNNPSFPENARIGVLDSPTNFVELLALGSNAIRELAPGRVIVSGSTTAINQNFPATIDYNRAMRDAGALALVDVYGIHYYGKQFENVIRNKGVKDFLNGLNKPIWLTESGAQGVNNQLAYGEQVWPFLLENIAGIERIYVFQFTEATPPDTTYGLRNLSADAPVSDLYVWLRDR